MSDTSQGSGWWQASDGKWYRPEDHPDHRPPSSAPQPVSPAPESEGPSLRWEAPPSTEPRAASMRGMALGALAVIALVIGVVIVVNSGESNDSTSAGPSTTQPRSQEIHPLGETVHTGTFDVVVNRFVDPFNPRSAAELPPLGQRFVLVELIVKNTSNEQHTMPMDLGASMLDSQSPRPARIATFETGLAPLDGPVGPGAFRAGWVAFAVSEETAGLRLRLRSDPGTTDYIVTLS